MGATERCWSKEKHKRVHGESVFGNNWRLTILLRAGYLQVPGCVCVISGALQARRRTFNGITELILQDSVQVNIPAESGEMGILANHVPAIEQLKPGLVEIIEEAGASKQFFRMSLSSIQ